MTGERPHVLFLTVDALRTDRLSLHGYDRPTTPNLERLAEEAIVCEQAISTAAFTQPALPSMLTSSMPLSFGGYDAGACGRPPTIFKVFSDAGYQTTLISTFPWVNRFYGYIDGVAREQMQFVINALVGVAAQTMASSLNGYRDKTINHAAMMEVVVPVVRKLFDDLDVYCELRAQQVDLDARDMVRERLLMDGYDYRRIKRIIARHRTEFRANPAAYIDRHLPRAPRAHQWIAADWRFARRSTAVLRYGCDRMAAALLAPLAPSRARSLEYRCKRYVDGAALADRIIHMVDTRDPDRPFFLWSHFLDTHVPYLPGSGRHWHRQAAGYLRSLGYADGIDPAVAIAGKPTTAAGWAAWSALYDGAARYIDEQIGRVVAALDERGLRQNTLIIIASDHGEELGEHGDISHHFRLYEHNIRVPMLFHRPGMKPRRVSGLTTILDLAPTAAELAGVAAANGWQGASVTSPSVSARAHVLAEAFHGDNCLFDHRPPYIAVRTRQYKYLWKEYRDPLDKFSHEGPELYDHRADPLEQENLYRPDHPELPALNRAVANRLAEIPEITSERIVAAFGAIGEDVVRAVRGRAASAASG